jgi:hypothetical protein
MEKGAVVPGAYLFMVWGDRGEKMFISDAGNGSAIVKIVGRDGGTEVSRCWFRTNSGWWR